MNEATKEKVDRARKYLLESGLPEDTKDGLQSLLDSAGAAANGSPDKIQALADAMLALAIHEVKAAVRFPGTIEAAVVAHKTQCMAGSPAGVWGLVYRMRWPLCVVVSVAFLSPNFPMIVTAALEFWK